MIWVNYTLDFISMNAHSMQGGSKMQQGHCGQWNTDKGRLSCCHSSVLLALQRWLLDWPRTLQPWEVWDCVWHTRTHTCMWGRHPVYTNTYGHMQYSLDHSMSWDYIDCIRLIHLQPDSHTHTHTQTARYHTDPLFCCRFSKSQKSSIHPGAFIPFGSGPRTCIGMRLAIMEAKMTLIEVLSKFRIVKAPETKVRLYKSTGEYRSIRCTSQNTEAVIQTFWQPTAAFISE